MAKPASPGTKGSTSMAPCRKAAKVQRASADAGGGAVIVAPSAIASRCRGEVPIVSGDDAGPRPGSPPPRPVSVTGLDPAAPDPASDHAAVAQRGHALANAPVL